VLHARLLGINCIVILEQYAELGTLLEAAARLGVQPAIGIRARLSTHHLG
jgi:arginine decarboxylase-like protein